MPEQKKRQLAAVMFTDMAGFTALVEADEARARQLRRRHREVIEAMHQLYEGELVQYFGDGTLSIFDSAVNAVQCAIEIQRALRKVPQVPLRIGLHAGEVIRDMDGLFGHAVNLASRLESFAVPGAILISSKLNEDLKNLPEFQVRSLGNFEFKNIREPVNVYAIANEGIVVPQKEELNGKGEMLGERLHNFPSQLTSFLGREREVAEVKALLQSSRLITLTGPGGTGKTRLSLQIAESLAEDFPDGIFFVALAPIREEEMVLPTIAKAVDFAENPAQSAQDNLQAYLEEKHILLVLDNFEQVVRAAPKISELLLHCPRLRILVSSRISLHIPGEQEYPVQPLILPTLKEQIDN
ncbi:MAG: adenylate/guanylate cyclase domain-containing protein, partial [Saprospiraceae bacterium]|nr:adenylate/guanylate cyclase domain-containing protein [Saprospiraceae bacterium]